MNSFPSFDFNSFPKDGAYENYYIAVRGFEKYAENIKSCEQSGVITAEERQPFQELKELSASAAARPIENLDEENLKKIHTTINQGNILVPQVKLLEWRTINSDRFQKDEEWQTICAIAKEKFQSTNPAVSVEWDARRKHWGKHAIFAHYTSIGLDEVHTQLKEIHKLYKKSKKDIESYESSHGKLDTLETFLYVKPLQDSFNKNIRPRFQPKISQNFITEYKKYLAQVNKWKSLAKKRLIYSMIARLEQTAQEGDITHDDLLFSLYNQVNQLCDIKEIEGFCPDSPLQTMNKELFQKFHHTIAKYLENRKAERMESNSKIAQRINALPWLHDKSVPFGIRTTFSPVHKQLFLIPALEPVRTLTPAYCGPSVDNLAVCTIYWSKLQKLIRSSQLNDPQQIPDIAKIIPWLVDFYLKQFATVQEVLDKNAKALQDVWKNELQKKSDELFNQLKRFTSNFFNMAEIDSKKIIEHCPIFHALNKLADDSLSIGEFAIKYKEQRAHTQEIVINKFAEAVLKQKMKPSEFFELFKVLISPQLKDSVDILCRAIRDSESDIKVGTLPVFKQIKGAVTTIWPENVPFILESMIKYLVSTVKDPRSPLLSIIKRYDKDRSSKSSSYFAQWARLHTDHIKEAQEEIGRLFNVNNKQKPELDLVDIEEDIELIKAYAEHDPGVLQIIIDYLKKYIKQEPAAISSEQCHKAIVCIQEPSLIYEFGKKRFQLHKNSLKNLLKDKPFFELLSLCPRLSQEINSAVFEYMNSHIKEVIQHIDTFTEVEITQDKNTFYLNLNFLSKQQQDAIKQAIDTALFEDIKIYNTLEESLLNTKLRKANNTAFPLTEQYKKEIKRFLDIQLVQHANSTDSALERVLAYFGSDEQKQNFYALCFEHAFVKNPQDKKAVQILLRIKISGYNEFVEKYGRHNIARIFECIRKFFTTPVFSERHYIILNKTLVRNEQKIEQSIDAKNYSIYTDLIEQFSSIFRKQYPAIFTTVDQLKARCYKKAYILTEKLEKALPLSGSSHLTLVDHHTKEAMKFLFRKIEEWMKEQFVNIKRDSIKEIKDLIAGSFNFKREFLDQLLEKGHIELSSWLEPLSILCKKVTARGLIALVQKYPHFEKIDLENTKVSRERIKSILYQLSALREIDLANCKEVTGQGFIALIQKCPNLKELDLSCTEVTGEGIERVAHQLSALRKINLSDCKKVTDRTLTVLLQNCLHLEELDLRWTEVSGEGIERVAHQLSVLKKINIRGCKKVTDRTLTVLLQNCSHLEELDLRWTEVSGEGIKSITDQLSALKKICLDDCKKVTDQGVIALVQKCPNLEELYLGSTEVSGEGIEKVAHQLSALKKINLRICRKVTDRTFTALVQNCPYFEEIDLSVTEVSCEMFENVPSPLNSLKKVNLSYCKKLTDQGLHALLQKCPDLEELNLRDTEVSCEVFEKVFHQLNLLKKVELYDCKKLIGQGLVSLVQKCPQLTLKTIDLSNKKVTDQGLHVLLQKCPDLEELNLSGTEVSCEMFENIPQLNSLKKINLFNCKELTDRGLVALVQKCPNLEELDLNSTEVSCEMFENIPQLNSLKKVNLFNCKELTDRGLVALVQKCPRLTLKTIDLSEKKVTEQELYALLQKCSDLEELYLNGTEVSCEMFENIPQLNSLKKVNLFNCKELTDRGLVALVQKCPNLEELDLNSTEVSCEMFENILQLNSLKKVNLFKCKKLTDRGLVALVQKCPDLEELNLSGTEVSCEMFEKVSHQLNLLKKVDLFKCKKLTDRGLVALAKNCPNLEELDLWGTEVSCEGFEKVSFQLNSFKKVDLVFCKKLTVRGLIALVQKCPQLTLKKIDLSERKVTEKELYALLQKCPDLEELNLNSTEVSCEMFESVPQLNSLKKVDLSHCKKVTDRGLGALVQKCPNLEEFNLWYTEVSCEGFEKVSFQLNSFKKVDLVFCKKLTGRGLVALVQKCPQLTLKTIDLSQRKVTEQELYALLQKCPDLEELYLNGTEVSCEVFEKVSHQFNSLKKVSLFSCEKLTDRGLVALVQKCPQLTLKAINLLDCKKITDQGLHALLQKCPDLEELNLWGTEVSCEVFENVPHQLNSLKEVDLSYCKKLTDQGLHALLQKCPDLEELNLWGTEVSCEVFENVPHQLNSLKRVKIPDSKKLTGRGLVALVQKCPQLTLKTIDLSERKVTEQELYALLQKCPDLEELNLRNTEISCEVFENISYQLNSLKKVDLVFCKKLTGRGLVALVQKCPQLTLKTIDLSHRKVTDQELYALLQKCPNLERLNLSGTEVSCEVFENVLQHLNSLKEVNLFSCKNLTDRGLVALAKNCPNLEKLDLEYTEISGEGIENIAQEMTVLKTIYLDSCKKLTDRGLVALLQKCPHLEVLNLSWTEVSGDGIGNIAHEMTALKSINLFACYKVTSRGLLAIVEKSPNLRYIELHSFLISTEIVENLRQKGITVSGL